MTNIVSKRHILKFYISIIGGTIFLIALGIALLFIYKREADKVQPKSNIKLMPIFSIVCFGFAGYSLYRYVKNVPTISVDDDFIKFNNQTFALSDIKKVELTGKRPFKYAIDFPMEAATIKFSNGDVKYVFDEMYSNSSEIKSFLKQVIIDKTEYTKPNDQPINENLVENEFYDTFKGRQFLSLRGISLWGLIGFIIYLSLNNKRPMTLELAVLFSCVSVFWFLLLSNQMNFFQVSDKYLLVRNHNFFWKRHVYNLDDIKEVVFETQHKMPNCLRIITLDFKTKLYLAGTLSDKTWLTLKDKLESFNIRVRNECI